MKLLKFISFLESRKSERELEIDSILDKISKDGISSLNDKEKEYLNSDIIDIDEDEYTFIDSDGNYILPSKENFLLNVIEDKDEILGKSMIKIEAYDKTGKYLIDDNFTDIFNILTDINIYDCYEGIMQYTGNMNISQLKNKLTNLGFKIKKN